MARIEIREFKGVAPAIADTKLAEGAATSATDCKIDAGSLVPEKSSTILFSDATPSNRTVNRATLSFYKYVDGAEEYWLTSDNDASFLESPVKKDTNKRIYMANNSYPTTSGGTTTYTYAPTYFSAIQANNWLPSNYNASATHKIGDNEAIPATVYPLGVMSPSAAPTHSVSGTATNTDTTYNTFYVYTYVSNFGEEGPPSPVSTLCQFNEGQTKTITVAWPTTVTANFADSDAKINIYRTASGSTTAEYLYVGSVMKPGTSFADTVEDAQLGEVMPSTNWFRPPNNELSYSPEGPLKQMVAMPNGFFAGFTGKTLAFSEQFLPHAWPPSYYLRTDADIVAIQDSTFGLVVLTETQPYLCSGNTPDVMSLQKLDSDQACVSKASVADLGGMVIYASPDGLMSISGNRTELLTKGILTRDQWQSTYTPTTMRGAVFEGRYYGFYTTGTTKKALVYDPFNRTAPLMHLNQHADFTFVSAKDDALYFLKDDKIYTYGAGTNLAMNWISRKYLLPIDPSFAWGQIIAKYVDTDPASDGQVRLRIDVERANETGVLETDNIFDDQIKSNVPFRLPPSFRGETLVIEIRNTKIRVDSVVLASTKLELM